MGVASSALPILLFQLQLMTELHHSKFSTWLAKGSDLKALPVFLIHGESALVEQCVKPLIKRLLNGESKDLHCQVLDGMVENIPDLLEQLNTYDLTGGIKVVWFKEAKLFDTGSGQQKRIEQICEAMDKDDVTRAAKAFMNLCARMSIDVGTLVDTGRIPPELADLLSATGDETIVRLASCCIQHGWSSSADADHVSTLEKAIGEGFPTGHFLIITSATRFPKNRKFYKIVSQHGVVVDCHVPLSERRADKMAQEAVLRQIMEEQLQKSGKRVPPAVFNKIVQLTGFDPTTFRNNIIKLIDYVGDRAEITDADTKSLLRRSKSDPIYALTNAVAERETVSALFYLNTLLDDNFHPLQILSALANQVRKLLVAKDFANCEYGRSWNRSMAYQQFQKTVMPDIQAYDAHNSQQVSQWDAVDANKSNNKKKGEGKGSGFDLALASNPGNAYPVYQTLLKSENFTITELVDLMMRLNASDMNLKRSGHDAVLLIRHLVMSMCIPMSGRTPGSSP